MNIENKRIWQVGAGDTDRNYGDLCCKYDVMIVGPGDAGVFSDEIYADFGDIKNSIRRFYGAERGDIVLLRIGTGLVLAAGEIADDGPEWLEAFGDVDGWDLQHTRRVRWIANSEHQFPTTTFGTRARTFAGVNSPALLEWLGGLKVAKDLATRDLAPLPRPGKRLDVKELAGRLFIEGLGSEYVDRLSSRLDSIQRVAEWYQNKLKRPESRPSESETICYLVVPLLFSLGWSEQTCAIEWKHVDVALFERMPSNDSTLSCVVEAKLLGRSVFNPYGQALEYARQPERKKCNRLIVTDGIRYVIHRQQGKDFKVEAYLNILQMRDGYELFGCGGAVEAIIAMAR
jgi:hypothetical protein